jgi:hypothetical protein
MWSASVERDFASNGEEHNAARIPRPWPRFPPPACSPLRLHAGVLFLCAVASEKITDPLSASSWRNGKRRARAKMEMQCGSKQTQVSFRYVNPHANQCDTTFLLTVPIAFSSAHLCSQRHARIARCKLRKTTAVTT